MSFIRNSIFSFFTQFIVLGISMGSGIIQARILGAEGVGILGLLLLTKTLTYRLGNLGIGSSISYFVGKNEMSFAYALKFIYKFTVFFALFSLIALVIVKPLSFSPWNLISSKLFVVSLFSIPIYILNSLFQRLLGAVLEISSINRASLIQIVTLLLGNFIFLLVLGIGIIGSVISILIADVVSIIYLWVTIERLKRSQIIENRSQDELQLGIKKILSYGWANYFYMILNVVQEKAPLIILKNIGMSFAGIGIFLKANEIGKKMRLVSSPISKVLFPYTTSASPEVGIMRTNILCRNSIIIVTPLYMFLVATAVYLVPFVYGEEFLPSVKLLLPLTVSVILYPTSFFIGIHVAAAGNPQSIAKYTMFGLLPGLVSAIILTIQYGLFGAAFGVSLITLCVFIAKMIAYMRFTKSGFSEVLILKRSDLMIYRRILDRIRQRIAVIFTKK
jgi:O-antigen/teichoic acid export membrane protein